MTDLLRPTEIAEIVETCANMREVAEASAKAQLAHTLQRFRKAVEDSRENKDIDLEEEYELFCAIQNSGIAKAALKGVCPACEGEKWIWVNHASEGYQQDECPKCHGTGRAVDREKIAGGIVETICEACMPYICVQLELPPLKREMG